MTDLLNLREGVTVDGFAIGQLLSVTESGAVYETAFAEAPHRTVLELREGDHEDATRRLALWRGAAALSHPHLLRLHAAGQGVVNAVPVIYAVMERADESLAQALSERTLSLEEANEILLPALSALDYLHTNGYTAGGLGPSKIVAVGNILKLATDGLQRRGEAGDPAADMWEFGALLAQSITGVLPRGAGEELPSLPEGTSGRLGDIILHCLDADSRTRWTAEEALASLTPHVPPAAVREEVASEPAHIAAVTARLDKRRGIYVAVAAVLFALALIGGLAWHRTTPAEISPTTQAAAPMATATPENPAPRAVAVKPKATASQSGTHSNSWVVVIASYSARGPAEKRVREIAKRWPRFHAELLEAASEKTHLLVVIGKNLSEKEAEALRGRARGAGLPRDTYIKRIEGLM